MPVSIIGGMPVEPELISLGSHHLLDEEYLSRKMFRFGFLSSKSGALGAEEPLYIIGGMPVETEPISLLSSRSAFRPQNVSNWLPVDRFEIHMLIEAAVATQPTTYSRYWSPNDFLASIGKLLYRVYWARKNRFTS